MHIGSRIPRRLLAGSRDRRAGHALVREPAERDAQASRHVADRVKGPVVGDDLHHVARPGAGQPHAGGDGDPQIAPVADAHRGSAVDELRAMAGQKAGGIEPDDLPVADGEEVGAAPHPIDGEMVDDAGDVLGPARVLDVEEDRATGGRHRPIGLWRERAGDELALRLSDDELRADGGMSSGAGLASGIGSTTTTSGGGGAERRRGLAFFAFAGTLRRPAGRLGVLLVRVFFTGLSSCLNQRAGTAADSSGKVVASGGVLTWAFND